MKNIQKLNIFESNQLNKKLVLASITCNLKIQSLKMKLQNMELKVLPEMKKSLKKLYLISYLFIFFKASYKTSDYIYINRE